MKTLNGISLQIANYKSFGEESGGFDEIKPVNIVIGRNNSGKSALLDAVEIAASKVKISNQLNHRGARARLTFSKPLTEQESKGVFNQHTSGGPIAGNHWQHAGIHLVGSRITIALDEGDEKTFVITRTRPQQSLQGKFARILLPVCSPY